MADGSDADIDNRSQVLLGALAVARKRVRIMNLYFLPDETLLAALKVTTLRGVAVDIVLPERSNLSVARCRSACSAFGTAQTVLDQGVKRSDAFQTCVYPFDSPLQGKRMKADPVRVDTTSSKELAFIEQVVCPGTL